LQATSKLQLKYSFVSINNMINSIHEYADAMGVDKVTDAPLAAIETVTKWFGYVDDPP